MSETLREFANLAAAALVLSQFIGDRQLSWPLLMVGVVTWVVLVGSALNLEGSE